ncbi:hypothetical protein NK718_12360 [Alsobacter sp. SYSU M60028]|uniref:Uncharacterized protein n=1 Tax=Alsobacter ponti TaxID=2962936 RepID=A0ABT1LDX8_9HYPH|nr:hypothetical protein [Alsobacter ponti]MCP8939311.1 hypothetical protein [Alsobacter ponti]
MLLRTLVLAAGAALLTSASVNAADMAYNPGYCGVMVRSPLLDQPIATMRQAVDERYERSVQVAEMTPTIYNTSPRFVWASEAKVACGMAIGFFGSGEVNEEMVSKCDCFYGRMVAYTGSLK